MPFQADRAVPYLLFLAAGGIGLPYWKGFEFLDPRILLAYSATAPLFLSPPLVSAIASDAGRSLPLSALIRRLTLAIGFGWLSAMLMSGLALGTVVANYGASLLPSTPVLISLAVISLLLAILGAAGSAVAAVRMSNADLAKRVIRTSFLMALLILVAAVRMGPDAWAAALLSNLTPEGMPWLAVKLAIGVVPVSAVLLRIAAADPRYSSRSA